jgi:molybdate transport system permease protein
MPLAVYVGMESNVTVGLTISILLVIISFTIMIAVRLIQKREVYHA